jgi:hypothetical protein
MAAADRLHPVVVEARFDNEGQVTPQRFTWQGREYRVDSLGRRWRDESGMHILIMIPGEQVYELIFAPDETRWYLKVPVRDWV